MGTFGVVLRHPGVEGFLGLVDGGVSTVVVDHVFLPIGAVEALHLARGGRRVGGGQAVLDAEVVTDPVEQHRPWSGAESGGEDFAVIGENLVGGTVLPQCEGEGVTHRPGCCSGHDAGTDAVAAVVVDAGDHLHLGAVGQIEATHDVHLPELHGLGPFPPLVVRTGPLAWGGHRSVGGGPGPDRSTTDRARVRPLPEPGGCGWTSAPIADDCAASRRSGLRPSVSSGADRSRVSSSCRPARRPRSSHSCGASCGPSGGSPRWSWPHR